MDKVLQKEIAVQCLEKLDIYKPYIRKFKSKAGTPCFFDNVEYMNAQGTTVFLDVPVERLFIRLSIARHKRPLIREKNDEELRAFIVEQLGKRMPHYSKAQHTFIADKLEDKTQIDSSVEAFCRQFNI